MIHVPHAGSFGAACERRDLHARPVAERHGLVWLGASSAPEVDAFLGGIGADLAALELDRMVLWRAAQTTRACNWKLVIEAFLDGYHIRVLHRDSIYRFFLDAASLAEPVGPHIRAVTARRALRSATPPLGDAAQLRELATPSYLVFPATVIIEHPDFVSLITVHPLAADRTHWSHLLLVPAERAHETEHWAASWSLIEDTVFQREDLWVCDQIQRGLASPATTELLFGSLESATQWFHGSIATRL